VEQLNKDSLVSIYFVFVDKQLPANFQLQQCAVLEVELITG